MADSKLAGAEGKILEISPMAKTTGLDARTRSDRRDRIAKEKPPQQAGSSSTGAAPAGAPRKFDFEEKTYSPRNIGPASPHPFVTQPVHQLVAACEGAMQGQETDEEATQRHNREAEAEEAARQAKIKAEYEARLADADKAEAALDAALEASKKQEWQLMHGDGELEPVEVTKLNPFAEAAQIPAATPHPAANAPEAGPTPTPHPSPKRKKIPSPRSSREGGEDYVEMDGEGGDPSTRVHEVQLKKIHQTLKKFSSRLIHTDEQIEGQGRMTDEVGAKRRMDEQEKISRTYGITGIPEQATTATTYLNWLIHEPEQADIPKHEICSDDCKWSKLKDGKKNFIVVFRTSASKNKIDAYMTKRTGLRHWDSTANQMWNNTKIYGRWTETRLQREERTPQHRMAEHQRALWNRRCVRQLGRAPA